MRACCLPVALLFAACSRPERVPAPPSTELFREIAAETGLRFRHFTGATGRRYLPEIMGSGCALFDYDSDGDLDVYVVQGAMLEPGKTGLEALFPPPAGQPAGNRLFRNELVPSGKLRFTDVTEDSGAAVNGYGMGVAVGDYDNDGRPDLYVTNFGENALLHNEGNGKFKDVTRAARAGDPRWSTGAAFFDYDRDGDLDLFVTNYVDFTLRGNKICHATTGEVDYCTPRAYSFLTDRLFRNEGNGTFSDVSISSRTGSLKGPGLGVAICDVNLDGWPDIFVANDSAANFLWINRKDGTFREQALEAGVAYAQDGMAKAGMGVAAGDFDNDGDEDILVVNLVAEGATLFRNDGGQFQDASLRHGIGAATMGATGFGAGWLDYDNDGALDLFIANGAVTMIGEQRGAPYPFAQRNLLLRNPGPTRRFEDVTDRAGASLAHPEVGRGAAFGDIDNDGDIDILVSNNNGSLRLLRNETGSRSNWFEARLIGTKSNRMAIGARVALFLRDRPPLWRHADTASSYLSASDSRAHFGIGGHSRIERLEVCWPSGLVEIWPNPPLNRMAALVEGTGMPVRTGVPAAPASRSTPAPPISLPSNFPRDVVRPK